MITLTPAYGRDYKNLKDLKADWHANKDFIINDIFSRWDGKPANKSDLVGEMPVKVRYGGLRKVTIFK